MKRYLIDKLFRVLERDKEVIKENLLKVMDEVILQTSDRYGKVTLTIKYERNEEYDRNNS